MKSLVVDQQGQLKIAEVSLPTCQDHQALVRTIACGVCNGTDAKLIHKSFKGFGPDAYPLMLGHEAVGEIIETGSRVTGLKKGDHVLLPFNDPIDGYLSGWGGFSEYGLVNDIEALEAMGETDPDLLGLAHSQTVLPEFIDPVEAVMVITLREVLSSIRRFGFHTGSRVVVFGCGPVGLTFIRMLKLLEVSQLVAIDLVEEKIEAALAAGADYAFNSQNCDVTETVRRLMPAGATDVLDAVGVSAIINQAMPLLTDQGKICCYGISANLHADIDWSQAPYNWQLQFQQFPAKGEEYDAHEQVITWLSQGDIVLSDFISDIEPFDQVLEIFQRLEKRQIKKKGIVTFP